jgi:hypothetical protein
MSHFKFVHEQNCDPARFWEVFFDEAYNQATYAYVGVKERQFLDMQDDGKIKTWVLRVFPQRDLPEFVKKMMKGDLGYIEHARMDKAANRIESRIEPTLFKDKTKINAVYTVASTAPGKCVRTFEGDVEVSIALIGRKVEDFIVADMTKAYNSIAEFTNEWLAKHA